MEMRKEVVQKKKKTEFGTNARNHPEFSLLLSLSDSILFGHVLSRLTFRWTLNCRQVCKLLKERMVEAKTLNVCDFADLEWCSASGWKSLCQYDSIQELYISSGVPCDEPPNRQQSKHNLYPVKLSCFLGKYSTQLTKLHIDSSGYGGHLATIVALMDIDEWPSLEHLLLEDNPAYSDTLICAQTQEFLHRSFSYPRFKKLKTIQLAGFLPVDTTTILKCLCPCDHSLNHMERCTVSPNNMSIVSRLGSEQCLAYFTQLNYFIQSCPKMRYLNLSGNFMIFNQNDLYAEKEILLASSIAGRECLQELIIGDCWTHTFLEYLCKSLKSFEVHPPPLDKIDVAWDGESSENMKEAHDIFMHVLIGSWGSNLRRLSLEYMYGLFSVDRFCEEMVAVCPKLRYLSLKANGLDDNKLKSIITSLGKFCPNLQILNFEKNHISNLGVNELVEASKSWKKLFKVEFAGNSKITVLGLISVIQFFNRLARTVPVPSTPLDAPAFSIYFDSSIINTPNLMDISEPFTLQTQPSDAMDDWMYDDKASDWIKVYLAKEKKNVIVNTYQKKSHFHSS